MDLSDIKIAFQNSGTDDQTIQQDIRRNVTAILSTPKGTCPLYRDFGIDLDLIDAPENVIHNMYALAVIEAVEQWEQRVKVLEVKLTPDERNPEKFIAKVVLQWISS